jgi:hypothetical protein
LNSPPAPDPPQKTALATRSHASHDPPVGVVLQHRITKGEGVKPLSIVAILSMLAVWISSFLLVRVPAVRDTMWPVFVLAGLALGCGVLSLLRDRTQRKLSRGLAWGGIGGIVLFTLVFLIFWRLPAPKKPLAAGQPLPAITLVEESGATLATAELKNANASGPLLFVFFRGFW